MPEILRIVEWDKHFENNRTKELKRMAWVPIPNKMDGDGYTQLLDHPNGAAHFGAWCALVEIASKCEPRGTLQRPDPAGRCGIVAHTPQSLARISRLPAAVFLEAIPRIQSIGWIEVIGIPQEGAVIPQEGATTPQVVCAPARARENGTEGNGTELKGKIAASPPAEDEIQKTQKRPTGDHAEIIAYFCQAWERRYRKPYPFGASGGKNGNHVKALLSVGIEDARAAIDRYLATDDGFLNGHPLGMLVSQLSKFIVDPKPIPIHKRDPMKSIMVTEVYGEK